MYDCNLIKSRAQKILESQLPDLQSMYNKTQMPRIPEIPTMPRTAPATPTPTAPMPQAPTTPKAPSLPPASPEPEIAFPLNPLRPRILPPAGTFTVPANPLLPPEYAGTLDYESLQYMNGFLRTLIGSYLEVEFLIGTSNLVKHYGILKGVGLNYILLTDPIADTDFACDFYPIKFIKVLAPFNEAADSLKDFHSSRREYSNSND